MTKKVKLKSEIMLNLLILKLGKKVYKIIFKVLSMYKLAKN